MRARVCTRDFNTACCLLTYQPSVFMQNAEGFFFLCVCLHALCVHGVCVCV